MDPVVIGDARFTVEDVVRVARGAGVELAPAARSRIRAGRAIIDDVLAGDEPVYGLNTGVGHMKDVRVPLEELRRSQEMLLMTHAGGIGPPASTEVVRAAIVTRLVGMAAGGSGATEASANVLAAMLGAGVHPIVPGRGSVGAGDLGPMATIGLVAIGRGRAEHKGEVLPGAEALARAGIEPLVVEPKDGLALMSANGLSIGQGALVVAHALDLSAVADVAAALSMEATFGNPSVVLPAVGEAKPFAGQIEACRSLSNALEGSFLLEATAARSVQDPLSFRVVPQVHGAFRELLTFARRAVEIELNSRSDNPLADVGSGTMIHNGNFHPMVMALAFDGLRVAAAHLGQLSERRMSHLWDTFFENLARAEAPPGGDMPELFGLSLRYTAAALVSELEQLAQPATLDVPPLDIGIEDHATGAPLSVQKTESALKLLEDITTIELMLARDVLSMTVPRPSLGKGTEPVCLAIEELLASDQEDRSPAAIHEAARAQLLEVIRALETNTPTERGG